MNDVYAKVIAAEDTLYALVAAKVHDADASIAIRFEGTPATAPVDKSKPWVFCSNSGVGVNKTDFLPLNFTHYQLMQIELNMPATPAGYELGRKLAICLTNTFNLSTGYANITITQAYHTRSSTDMGYKWTVAVEYQFDARLTG